MDKGILIKGGILIFIFASVIPVTFLWIGDPEINRDLFPVALNVATGILITFGLPVTWLAWQSERVQQLVFTSSQSKMVLVLATIITAMSMASMYNFKLISLPLLFM